MSYQLDYDSIVRGPDDCIAAVIHLTDLTNDPRWKRDPLCRRCHDWEAGVGPKGIDFIPRRPGTSFATEGCAGCWYAMLEQTDDIKDDINPHHVCVRKMQTQDPVVRLTWKDYRIRILSASQIHGRAGGMKTDSVSLDPPTFTHIFYGPCRFCASYLREEYQPMPPRAACWCDLSTVDRRPLPDRCWLYYSPTERIWLVAEREPIGFRRLQVIGGRLQDEVPNG